MPRAFLITNKRYESTSSTLSSILDQKKQVLVHSKGMLSIDLFVIYLSIIDFN